MSERRIPYLDEELKDGVSADVGAPDISILRTIRDLFLKEEPLVEGTYFDNPLDPKTLHIEFADGLGEASWSRMDITWYRSGAYRFHYVDENDINWRFDSHPNTHSPEKHFHEPPDTPSETATRSCICVEEPSLVTRAVLKLWRRAYNNNSLEDLNSAQNPP